MRAPQQCQASVSRFFRPKKRPKNEIEQSGDNLRQNKVEVIEILDDTPERHDVIVSKVTRSNATKDVPAGEGDVAKVLLLTIQGNEDIQIVHSQHVAEDCAEIPTTKNDAAGGEEDLQDESESSINVGNSREGKFTSTTKQSRKALESQHEDTDLYSKVGSAVVMVNPFAKFAFTSGSSREHPPPAKWKIIAKRTTDKDKKSRNKSGEKKDWIRVADCSPEEQERMRIKWHSFAHSKATLQVRRFQVLVAACLHVRCQDPVVRKVMEALHEQFVELNVDALANCDAEGLAIVLSSLQYYNTKAKHLVAASREIKTQFQGKVPETESLLRQITGIGPVMADLLASVNTIEAHLQAGEESVQS